MEEYFCPYSNTPLMRERVGIKIYQLFPCWKYLMLRFDREAVEQNGKDDAENTALFISLNYLMFYLSLNNPCNHT